MFLNICLEIVLHSQFQYTDNNPIDHISRECNELKNFDLFDTRALYIASLSFVGLNV